MFLKSLMKCISAADKFECLRGKVTRQNVKIIFRYVLLADRVKSTTHNLKIEYLCLNHL